MKVKDLLTAHSGHLYTITPGQTVAQALTLMSGYHVSALVVITSDAPQGIFTEKDLVRCYILFPDKPINEILIKDVMTSRLVVAEPEDTIENAVGMMIKAKIRHLPVIFNGQIKGILGLEDLVKNHVNVLTREIHYLKSYISDLQDASHD